MVKRLAAGWIIMLCVAMLLSACGTPAREEERPDVPSGRYVEERLALPEGYRYFPALQQVGEESFRLLGMSAGPDYRLKAWSSEDACRSWTELPLPWLAEMETGSFLSAAFTEEGLYVAWIPEDSGLDPDNDDHFMESYMNAVRFGYGDVSGFEERDAAPVYREEQDTPGLMRVSRDGDLVVGYYSGIGVLDLESMQVKQHVSRSMQTFGGEHLVFDDTLAISDAEKITLYSMETGEETAVLPFPTPAVGASAEYGTPRIIATDADHTAFYYCDGSGIFRMLTDGSITEELVEGSRSTLSLPSVSPAALFVPGDGSLLVHHSEGEKNGLLRYVYDPDVPLRPKTELTVYSLEENATIRQAVVMYQQHQPDVLIRYEVGRSHTDAVTVPDALRSLSTALLAGEGPDILILDGMPVESYIQKNVLADLSDVVASVEQDSSLLEAPIGTWRNAGGCYAVPARISIPMIGGTGIADVHDIPDLTRWVRANGGYLSGLSAHMLAEALYDSSAHHWLDGGNGWNEEAFRSWLTQVGELAEAVREDEWWPNQRMEDEQQRNRSISDGAIQLFEERLLVVGNFDGMPDAELPWSVFLEKGSGELKPFPDGEGSVYIPRTILGLNASGNSVEEAGDFVGYVLGEELQSHSLSDGIPVNRRALANSAENPYAGGSPDTILSSSYTNPDTGEKVYASVTLRWPTEEVMQDLIHMAESVQVAAPNDLTVRQIVAEGTSNYMTGGDSLENAVAEVSRKMELYLAEKE